MQFRKLKAFLDSAPVLSVSAPSEPRPPAPAPLVAPSMPSAEPTAGTESMAAALLTTGEVTEVPSGVPAPIPATNLPYCPVFIGGGKNGGRQFTCYITGQIREVQCYLPLLQALIQATEQDVVNIYIDSPGGYVFTGTTICSLIKRCKGRVFTIARGMCASAGSLIWSAGHECLVEPYANFMYHMSSHIDMGNSAKIMEKARGTVEYIRRCLSLDALTKGHITQEELDSLTETYKDVWISALEMQARLDRGKAPTPTDTEVPDTPVDPTDTSAQTVDDVFDEMAQGVINRALS